MTLTIEGTKGAATFEIPAAAVGDEMTKFYTERVASALNWMPTTNSVVAQWIESMRRHLDTFAH